MFLLPCSLSLLMDFLLAPISPPLYCWMYLWLILGHLPRLEHHGSSHYDEGL
jgi:hypothetical protein